MFHQERRNRALSILVLATFPFVCFLAGYVVTLLSAGLGTVLATTWERLLDARVFDGLLDAGHKPSVLPQFWYSLILWGSTVLVGLGGTAIPIWFFLGQPSPPKGLRIPLRHKSVERPVGLNRVRRDRVAIQKAQSPRSRLLEDGPIYVAALVALIPLIVVFVPAGWLIGELMIGLVLTGGLAMSGFFSNPSLYGGYVLGALGLAFAIVAWFRASNITVALAGARIAGPRDGPLLDLVASVAIGAGIPTPEARVLDESAPAIFSVGSANGRAVVLVSSGLLRLLTRDQLEAVVAHEAVRIRSGDGRLTATLMALFGSASMLARRLLNASDREAESNDPLALVVEWFGLMARLVGDGFGTIVKAAFGRTRELLADAEAVEVTRDPAALIAALKKIQSNAEVVAAGRNGSVVSSMLAPDSLLRERLRTLESIASVRET